MQGRDVHWRVDGLGTHERCLNLTTPAGAGYLCRVKKLILSLSALALLSGCVLKFRGQDVISVNPDGHFFFEHPEYAETNRGPVLAH